MPNWLSEFLGRLWNRIEEHDRRSCADDQAILGQLEKVLKNQDSIISAQNAILSAQAEMGADLQKVLQILAPPLPVKFIITITGENSIMTTSKATLDFQLLDNGTAAATLQPIDAALQPTTLPTGTPVPSWASSDHSVIVTPAADGMSATVAPASPAVLKTGVTITATTTLASGTAISGTALVDVVAGGPTGFSISLQ